MILSELPAAEFERRLGGRGLMLGCGPFTVRVISPLTVIRRGLELLYADHPVLDAGEFADVELRLRRKARLAPFLEPQVVLDHDGEHPFTPLPLSHALPFFEWALNWSIAVSANQYLILHAAVLERGGRALILPGPPGSGKSTLAAGLTARGWRLLSDELTLIDTATSEIVPIPRPISLKNRSIDIMRAFIPGAVLGPVVDNTHKGAIAHLRPDPRHIARAGETARAGWIVFPAYAAGAASSLTPHSRADTVLELGNNSFNYHLQGRRGFEVLTDLVQASQCYDFEYSDLEAAAELFAALAGEGS